MESSPSSVVRSPAGRTHALDRVALGILALHAVFVVAQVWRLAAGDIVLTYPFMWPDSFDWLVNGVYWLDVLSDRSAGAEPTIRQPVISFLSSLALAVGTERVLLCFLVLCTSLTILTLWQTARELRVIPEIRAILVVTLTLHYSYQFFSLYYMADQLTCLFAALALRSFLQLAAIVHQTLQWRPLIIGSAWSALACTTQFYGIFPALVAGCGLALQGVVCRRWNFLRAALVVGAISLSIESLWRTVKWVHFGSFNATHVSHFELLRFSVENARFYAQVWPIFFAPLIGATLVLICSRVHFRLRAVTNGWRPTAYLGGVVVLYALFVFIYQWQESRFTTYFLGPTFLLWALLMNRIIPHQGASLFVLAAMSAAGYLALVPTSDLMRPKIRAYLHTMVQPSSILRGGIHGSLQRTQPLRRLNQDPCFDRPSLSGEPILPGCDPYMYRSFQRYQFFRQRHSSPAPIG